MSSKRKRGETIRRIAELLISNPKLKLNELSKMLNIKYATARNAYQKLKDNPEIYASRFSINACELKEALLSRNERKRVYNTSARKVLSEKQKLERKRKQLEVAFLKRDSEDLRVKQERKKLSRWLWQRRKNQRGL